MTNQLSKWLISISAATLLSACLSPPTHFYVLEPMGESPSPVVEKSRQIGIGPVSIPTLLERKQIVTRSADNSVNIAEFHQWAAPLKDNVLQVLSQNLATLQPGDLVRAYPWSAYGAVDYRIVIDITRFDAQPERAASLEANWAIMNEKTHSLINNGHSKIEQRLEDSSYPATVKALNTVLGKFSRELSAALNKTK